MTRLRNLSWRDVEKALLNCGFQYAPKRGKGSHRAYCLLDKGNRARLVIVPQMKSIPAGTLHAIIKLSGLTIQQFLDCLVK